MKKFNLYYFFPSLLVLLLGYTIEILCQNSMAVKLNEVNAWADFMPGSVHSFHVTGKLEIISSDTTAVSKFVLDSVYVFQAGKKYYSFKPEFKKVGTSAQNNSHSGYSIIFSFGNNAILKLKKNINLDEKIHIELEFRMKGKSYILESHEIEIKKTY